MNTGVRVKRFLDVDSDSDLEDSRHSNGASPKTLSFRTETASKQVAAAPAPAAAPRKGSFASNTSSIVFESDIEVDSKSPREVQSSKASKAPSIDVAPKATPAAAAAAPAKPSATAAAPQPNPKSHTAATPAHNTTAKAPVAAATAKSGAAAFAFPTKAHTTPAPAPAVKTAKSPAPIKPVRLPLDEESLSEVEPVVKSNIPTNATTTTNTTTMVATPTTNGATAALHTPVSQTASSLGNATNVEELLQRAKTRLEDRGSAAPTPRSSCRGTPQRRDSFVRSSIERPSAQQEARVRRLIQENARLQDEVRFLHGDNQRLKALNNTAPTESVESVRHTLTIDMLKKELHSKELEHERRVTNIKAESDGLRRQTNELIEQCEGYASSAAQYKQLYNDKLKELEKLKTQFQALMSDLNNIDRKQEAAEEQHNKQLAAERDRSQRLEMTLADAKRQRTHLQELNNQLQTEVAAAIDGRKKASGAAVEAEERSRAERAELERQLTAQRAEIDKFRALLQDREQNQGVQLREAERQRREVQDRLQSLMADAKAEKQRLSKALDDAKEDSRRVLREEVERRLKVEDALRKVETERRTSIAAPPKALVAKPSAEVEQRLTAVRKELSEEQSRRRAAEQEAERQSMEVDRWKQASEYYQNECDASTQNISHAEVLREKAEQQSNVLRATLNQMIEKDEGQSLRLHELEMALEEARRAPQHPHADSGDVVEDIHQLSDENERLTMECTRLATERDALTEENAIIAAELLRWKKEVQQFVSSQGSASPPTKR